VEAASRSVSGRQNTYQFIDDKLLLYTRRFATVSDLSVTGITCHDGGRRLANGRRTTSHDATEIVCESGKLCDNHFDKVDNNYRPTCILRVHQYNCYPHLK